MLSLEQTFSVQKILRELCRQRVKEAAQGNRGVLRTGGLQCNPSLLARIFPPRQLWHRFRWRHRHGKSRAQVCEQALFRAVQVLAAERPEAPWAVGLSKVVRDIQERALHDAAFSFAPPRVVPVPKPRDCAVFRPIATFSLGDAVIGSLAGRYLRRLFDPVFHPSCLAFRAGQKGAESPDRTSGVEQLLEFRTRHQDQPLYVVEIDLRGFFDCVDHEVVWRCLDDLTAQAGLLDRRFVVPPRAMVWMRAYLDSYSFTQQVKGAAEAALQKRNPKARFAWAEDALRTFHDDPRARRIGIAQGGALSNFLANVVLHRVDDRVEQMKADTEDLTYLRFSDDFIMVSTSRELCTAALGACLATLKELKLPVHPPQPVTAYGPKFWESKSRAVYRWCQPQQTADAPWIQFLGYQIRYDGVMRVAPSAVTKQRGRLCAETDGLMRQMEQMLARDKAAGKPPACNGMSVAKVLCRFHRRFINLSVGKLGIRATEVDGKAPCWTNGFRTLVGHNLIATSLKQLDHYREKQLRRMKRFLVNRGLLPAGQKGPKKYWGYPFSYWAQFHR